MLAALLLAQSFTPTPDLVADLNQDPEAIFNTAWREPVAANSNGEIVYFAAGGLEGEDLWVSDGSELGTFNVRVESSTGQPVRPALLPAGVGFTDPDSGAVVLTATEPDLGRELYGIDGPSGVLRLIRDIRPGPESSEIVDLVELAGRVYFFADDGEHGRELWSTDGTPDGTGIVFETVSGPGSTLDGDVEAVLTLVGNRLLIVDPRDGASLVDLWVTDGVSAPDAPFTTLQGDGYPPLNVVVLPAGRRALIELDGSVHSTDGTQVGTFELFELAHLEWSRGVGARSFVAVNLGSRRSLYSTDGTREGSELLFRSLLTEGFAQPTLLGQELLFLADLDRTGWTLMRSDGTAAGTLPALDVSTGAFDPMPRTLLVDDGQIYLELDSDPQGARGLYVVGPGFDGPRLVTALDFAADVFPKGAPVALANGIVRVYPTNPTSSVRNELWRLAPRGPETVLSIDVTWTASSEPRELTRVGERLFFIADRGGELGDGVLHFYQHGVTPEPVVVKLIDGRVVRTDHLTPFGRGVAYIGEALAPFNATAAMWTDGVNEIQFLSQATELFTPTFCGPQASTVWRDRFYFLFGLSFSSAFGCEPHATDLEFNNAQLIETQPGPDSLEPNLLLGVGNQLVIRNKPGFGGFFETAPSELWVSQGGPFDAVRFFPSAGGSPTSYARSLVVWRDRLWFLGNDRVLGEELWTSDLTVAGTLPVTDLSPDGPPTVEGLAGLRVVDDRLVLLDRLTGGGTDLLAFDGSSFDLLANASGTLFETGRSVSTGRLALMQPLQDALFVTDGTVGGTLNAKEVAEQAGFVGLENMAVAVGTDRFLIGTRASVLADERLTLLDPTGGVAEVIPNAFTTGPGSSFPVDSAERIGRTLYFAARRSPIGIELFSLDLGQLGVSAVEPWGTGCGDAAQGLDVSGEPSVGATPRAELEAGLPGAPALLFASLDPAAPPNPGVCAELLIGPVAIASGLTDPTGRIAFDLPIPPEIGLVGTVLHLQAALVEPSQPLAGYGLSNAVELLVGR